MKTIFSIRTQSEHEITIIRLGGNYKLDRLSLNNVG